MNQSNEQDSERKVRLKIDLENLVSRDNDAARMLDHTGYATTAANLRKAVDRFREAFKADQWADAIAHDRESHTARLAGIKQEVQAGTYDTPDKVCATVDAMLEQVFDRR